MIEPPPLRSKAGMACSAGEEHAREVNLDGSRPRRDRTRARARHAIEMDACVGDDDIEASEGRVRSLHCLANRALIRDIGGEHQGRVGSATVRSTSRRPSSPRSTSATSAPRPRSGSLPRGRCRPRRLSRAPVSRPTVASRVILVHSFIPLDRSTPSQGCALDHGIDDSLSSQRRSPIAGLCDVFPISSARLEPSKTL